MREYHDPASPLKISHGSDDTMVGILGTAMPNLWRYLSWPLFVDAYEMVAWADEDDDEEQKQHQHQQKEMEKEKEVRAADKTARLARMGRALAANCLVDAVVVLDRVRAKRMKGRVWRWDDAFEGRCIFAV